MLNSGIDLNKTADDLHKALTTYRQQLTAQISTFIQGDDRTETITLLNYCLDPLNHSNTTELAAKKQRLNEIFQNYGVTGIII